ncbi:Syntaxin 6, N-terminal [Dillenia turbinata]|uniref:Syntaxin 6, N-terminal n=1 Tax=Dillenia turbinata TaxID=194707 RepID=A0AAN8W0Y2_9MAGN
MALEFDRWEKDPFFSAAEEVQESADRMGSTYRTWIHALKDPSNSWDSEGLRRDLRTALGTTKWQLEEFVRAVGSSYKYKLGDDARDRHRQFILAIESEISTVETSLQEAALSEGKASVPWVGLDEGERDELALFLSGPSLNTSESTPNLQHVNGELLPPIPSKKVPDSAECGLLVSKEEKFPGHRRTASASADIGSWKISVVDDTCQHSSSSDQPEPPPRKTPSFSGILGSMESAAKLKWPKHGIRKWKVVDRHEDADSVELLPATSQLTRGVNAYYERNKSCLDSCDECYDKYGWYGAIQRLFQRSQYQVQYSRPIRLAFSVVLLLFLIG